MRRESNSSSSNSKQATPASPALSVNARGDKRSGAVPPATTAPAAAGKTFNWLTSFPGPDELDAFVKSTLVNASIARTCLKEAAETKERLKEAVSLGESMVEQCAVRIKARNRRVAEYQEAVNGLRAKAEEGK